MWKTFRQRLGRRLLRWGSVLYAVNIDVRSTPMCVGITTHGSIMEFLVAEIEIEQTR